MKKCLEKVTKLSQYFTKMYNGKQSETRLAHSGRRRNFKIIIIFYIILFIIIKRLLTKIEIYYWVLSINTVVD